MGHTPFFSIPCQVTYFLLLLSAIYTLTQYRFEKLSKALPIGAMDSKYKRMIATFKGEMERIARYLLSLRFMMNISEGCSSDSKRGVPFRGTIQHHQVTDLLKYL